MPTTTEHTPDRADPGGAHDARAPDDARAPNTTAGLALAIAASITATVVAPTVWGMAVGRDPATTVRIGTLSGSALGAVAGVLLLRSAHRQAAGRRLPVALAAVGVGSLVLALGTVGATLGASEVVGPLDDGHLTSAQLAGVVLMAVGALVVPTARRRDAVVVIDATLVVLAGVTLLWVAPLRGRVEPAGGLIQVLRADPAMAATVVLMLAAATLLVRVRPDRQWSLQPLVIGLLVVPAAFYTAAVARLGGGNVVGETVSEMYWVTAPVLFAASALRTATPPGATARSGSTASARIQAALPAVAVVVILVGAGTHQWFMGELSPTTMAMALITALLTVARQVLLQGQQRALLDELRGLADEQAHAARHDRLTGLGNRTALGEHLAALLRGPEPAEVSVFFIDLDNFKAINDALGHDTGDAMLVELSVRLSDVLGPGLFRIGGDEFIGVRADLDAERAAAMAAALVAALEPALMVGGRPVTAAASIGLARSTPRGNRDRGRPDTAAALLRRADLALYRAKELGRGRWAAYDAWLQDRADRRLDLQQGLRRAVEARGEDAAGGAGDLEVVFEPRVALPGREVVGATALLRWHSPGRGDLEHDEVLAVADEAGLRPQLLDLVLDEVGDRLAEAAALPGGPLWISVRPDDVGGPTLLPRLSAVLAAARTPPDLLQIQIPEATVADHRTADALDELLRLGVGLIVTGFGNGPSSLRFLARYPAPAIAVDPSFVNGIALRREDRLIVEAVGRLSAELGLALVGEGVTSELQAAHLEALGAARASGPLFGRPLPWEEFVRRHRRHRRDRSAVPAAPVTAETDGTRW